MKPPKSPLCAVAETESLREQGASGAIEDGLMVVGDIVGGSDERVEPWDMSLDDAMARLHDEYVVHYDQNWVVRTWFAVTETRQARG
jgi:hypothetical protein